MADPNDQTTNIQKNAGSPQEYSIHDRRVKSQSIPDQIAADQYLASKAATGKRKFPVGLFKVRPPAASDVDHRC